MTYIPLYAWKQLLHCRPYIIHGHCLHTGTIGMRPHLAEEKTRLTRGMTPERDMFWIIQRIGSILFWTGRAKNGNDRNTHGCCQMHWAAIITDEKGTSFE